MVHEWNWWVTEWNSLPEYLKQCEIDGWEIFSVTPLGELERFVKVLARRAPAKAEANEVSQFETEGE